MSIALRTTPPDRFAQHREAVLWAQVSHGADRAALLHETALLVFGLSDGSPAKVYLTAAWPAAYFL